MDRTLFRYDESSSAPRRRKTNLFGWTIAILLLSGLALAAWLGSFYVFAQPERPESYRILQKLKKIEQPKRFQLTAGPAGEFLSGKQLYERYSAMRPAELAKKNGELARNYIRNFQQVRGAVPYVVGRFTIMGVRELGETDLFPSGMVALTNALDYGELLVEHVFPADLQSVPLMKQTLAPGLEIKLDRKLDLSAVIHAERLRDGRVLITAVPLLYGTYTATQGRGTFSLEPPFRLNMHAGWPLFKDATRVAAEERYAGYRQRSAPAVRGIPLPGSTATPPLATAANELIRVEPALPVAQPSATAARGRAIAARPTPTPAAVAARATPRVAAATPAATAAALQAPGELALASTAGGGSWKTFPPGKMPAGRLIATSDLQEVAQRGVGGERLYLRGQFVVNFAEAHRAVLRPRSNMAESVLRFGAPSSTRIIVEFPSGYAPPAQGSTVTRDEARPYEITEVREQSDGQLNVFVREIMQ